MSTSQRFTPAIVAKFSQMRYRSLLIASLMLGGNLMAANMMLAASPAPGTVIQNQATGTYLDTSDSTTKTVESDVVQVTVGEVAGITITSTSTPTATTGSVANFDFTITNIGNDPTKFFLPMAPSSTLGGTAGTLQIFGYIPAGGSQVNLTTPIDITANDTGTLMGSSLTVGSNTITNGSIPVGAAIVVRVPVTVSATAGNPVTVTLGNTGGQPSASNTPYVLGANGTGGQDVYTVDNANGSVTGESAGDPINGDTTNHRQEASASQTVNASSAATITVSGTVFSDADANVAINSPDAGTNAGSSNLTVYAINGPGNVVAKSLVAADGTYSLANVPANASVKLRLSNDNTVAVGATAPTAPSLPAGWFHTGENLNGTIDPVIATLGDIALTTTAANLVNENFGIRQATTIAADPLPSTCTVDYTTALNTGVTAAGGKLALNDNDLNWTADWIAGPASGASTPYATPRPVGTMPAVVVGQLAGPWVVEPSNARWISYPFRLPSNGNGVHVDADLDGTGYEGNTVTPVTGTTDTVRLKFTAKVSLPSNANTIAISLPVGVAIDNQFVSIKVNGVENLSPTPVGNPNAADFGTTTTVNLTQGWQAGVNTIEITMDSAPGQAGFFLGVQATTTQVCPIPVTVSGKVFSDSDANVAINGSDTGTNAGSSTLTIYAVNTAGNVVDKATVDPVTGNYTLSNVPDNSAVKLRLSNDSTVAIGATAPTTPSLPAGWFHTGENLNGTIDPVIATLGDIALTTTNANLVNENFGIRQATTIAADPLPSTCTVDYTTALNTGVTAAGGKLALNDNDLNWTADWIAGPASGASTPYATPRPVGTMPAVVVGQLAGPWVVEPSNARWISYPFRLPSNGNGVHVDADLDGTGYEGNTVTPVTGTTDTVRLKFTAKVSLPSNANTIAISLPVGVAIDNQFVSLKVNGVENLIPTPVGDPNAADYDTTTTVNLTQGWQAGVNTIEITMDSAPGQAGFFLGVQATTTQVCPQANVLLVKRITAVNGNKVNNPNDATKVLNTFIDDGTPNNDDNNANWPTGFLKGALDAGKVKPSDTIEYTIYFLNKGDGGTNTVKICDRITGAQTLALGTYNTTGDLQLYKGGGTTFDLTSASDVTAVGDRAELMTTASAPANCHLDFSVGGPTDSGTLVIDVTGTGNANQPNWPTVVGSSGPGTADAYGSITFTTTVNP